MFSLEQVCDEVGTKVIVEPYNSLGYSTLCFVINPHIVFYTDDGVYVFKGSESLSGFTYLVREYLRRVITEC